MLKVEYCLLAGNVQWRGKVPTFSVISEDAPVGTSGLLYFVARLENDTEDPVTVRVEIEVETPDGAVLTPIQPAPSRLPAWIQPPPGVVDEPRPHDPIDITIGAHDGQPFIAPIEFAAAVLGETRFYLVVDGERIHHNSVNVIPRR